jgi:membrane peptidoglycan carboxypeptidase
MVPSLALGTGEVTLLELTAAYTAFANQGIAVGPRLIVRVEDSDGTTIWQAPERRTQAITPTTAYLMSSMLADVVSRGTGAGARAAGFKLPAAGKTGTTDDFADAWFIGYTPHLVAGVWFGLDRPAPIMRDGFAGVVAAPAWGEFMRAATSGAKPDWYAMPSDVEKVAICRLSGARATDACRHEWTTAVEAAFTGTADQPLQMLQATYALPPVPALPAPARPQLAESSVYEDLFPIGAVPIDFCPIHSGGGLEPPASDGPSVSTPLVDVALQPRPPGGSTVPQRVGTTGHAVPQTSSVIRSAPGRRIVVERVVGADGIVRYVMRQVR